MKQLLPLFAALLLSLSLSAQKTEKCLSDVLYQERIAKDSSLRHRAEELEEKTKAWAKKGPGHTSGNAVMTIPVVVHVIHNGEAVGVGSNISEEQILSQIEVLNADFRHLNPDSLDIAHPFWDKTADCRIEFCLAQYDPYGIPTSGITRQKGDQDAWDISTLDATLKPATIWNPKKYLNIWSVNFNDDQTLGYAYRPAVATEFTDGMVLRHQVLGKTGSAGTDGFLENNLGRTGTHEVGHWLNLIHIWGDNICGNDEVADTEPALLPNEGCPAFPHNANNNCGSGQYGEMYMNYMDYVDDPCMNMFTKGQGDRMLAALEVARPGLLKSKACATEPPCEAPTGLTISQISTTGAVANWKVAPYSKQYIFQYRQVNDSVWSRQTTFYNSIALGNLEPGKTYAVRLASICVDGETDFGETVTFSTTNVTCNPPAWIIENPNSIGEIRWQSVASSYLVEIRPKGTTRWVLFNASSNQFNLLSILAPGTYQIRVQSVCTDKISNYSSVFEYTANFLCPGISNLYINDIRQEHVTLRWLNVVGAEKFNLYLHENGAWTLHEFPIDSVLFGRGDMKYVFRGLKPGTKYKALLRAVCKNQDTGEYYEGYAQNTQDFETLSLCDKPENLSVSNIGQTTAYLSWTPVPGATKYRIDYFDSAKNYWTTNPSLENIADPYKTIGVEPGSVVTVRVVAYCSGSSTSLPSDALSFETLHCSTPSIAVSNIKKNAATISWTPAPIENVAVEIYRAYDNYWSHHSMGTGTGSFTPYLLANTVYYARVVIICGGGVEKSEMSPLIPFKTLSTDVVVGIPELPDPLALHVFPNPTSGFLTLDMPGHKEQEAFDYEIRNLYGSLLQRGRFTTSPSTIDATSLTSGMYVLDIKGLTYRQVLPFVKI